MLFSVIIPTLNEEHYLPKLLTDQEKQLLYLPFPRPDKQSLVTLFLFGIATQLVVFLQHFGKVFSFGPGIVIDKQFFEKIGGFDEKAYIVEDHGLIMNAYKYGVKAR